METISSIDKKSQFISAYHRIQSHYLQNQTKQPPQQLNYSTSILNQKSQFLKYASSLIQITTEDQIPHQLQLYEQSQLINPPESLILQYQILKNNHQNLQISFNQPKKSLNNSILQALQNLSNFLERFTKKRNNKTTFNSSETLINILALSSVENFTQKDQQIALKHGFHQLKSYFYKIKTSTKISRPLLPIDKKKNLHIDKSQFPKVSVILLDQNKKQGVEQIAGSLTFKVLQIESQSFVVLKKLTLKITVLNFLRKIRFVFCRTAFEKIKYNYKHSNLSKFDSKLLTLSRSKSKGSISKLKINNLKSKSEKKISIKRLNSHQNTNFSNSGNQFFQERIISSEILEEFDFTQLQSNVDDQQYQKQYQKKMQFNNRLKKKSLKQSESQAQTLDSLRSLQSQEYQFFNGTQRSKVLSSLKPVQIKTFKNVQNIQQDEDLPTSKIIHYDVKKKTTFFQTKLFNVSLNQAKQIKLFNMKERRYMNVRTNLFELPLQLDLNNQQIRSIHNNKMQKVYHLMADKLIKHDNLTQEKDHLLTNLISLDLSKSLENNYKQRKKGIQKDIKEKLETLNRINQKSEKQFQNQYLQSKNINSQKNIYFPVQNTQTYSQKKQELQIKRYQSQRMPARINSPKLNKEESKNMNKPQKLKSNKLTKNNFEQYYFKAQIRKIQTSNNVQQSKNQSTHIKKPTQIRFGQISGNNQLYQAQYRTSKIQSQGNVKFAKSLSPKVKVSLHSPYRTGKLGNRVLNKNINNQTRSGLSQNSSKMSLQKFASVTSGFLPLQIQSSANTPTNIHNFVPKTKPNIINTNQSSSKMKVFPKTSRSLSPQQNNIKPHFFISENLERKVSFVNNGAHYNVIEQNMNHFPSNTLHLAQQISTLVPTISNLSNQSKLKNRSQNINQVINYGPNAGFNKQSFNRPSSILSAHSNQNRQRVLIGRPSQVIMSPTQRIMHGIDHLQIRKKNVNSPIKNNQVSQLQPNINQKRGLNVMTRNNPIIHSQNPSTQIISLRQKSVSNQIIFNTPRK